MLFLIVRDHHKRICMCKRALSILSCITNFARMSSITLSAASKLSVNPLEPKEQHTVQSMLLHITPPAEQAKKQLSNTGEVSGAEPCFTSHQKPHTVDDDILLPVIKAD